MALMFLCPVCRTLGLDPTAFADLASVNLHIATDHQETGPQAMLKRLRDKGFLPERPAVPWCEGGQP